MKSLAVIVALLITQAVHANPVPLTALAQMVRVTIRGSNTLMRGAANAEGKRVTLMVELTPGTRVAVPATEYVLKNGVVLKMENYWSKASNTTERYFARASESNRDFGRQANWMTIEYALPIKYARLTPVEIAGVEAKLAQEFAAVKSAFSSEKSSVMLDAKRGIITIDQAGASAAEVQTVLSRALQLLANL